MSEGKELVEVRGVGEQPDYLKVPEVQRRLRLARSSVYALMDRGELAYVRFGRARRIPRSSLEEYIRKVTVPARV